MSIPTSTSRPRLSNGGNHWQSHGATVRHRQRDGAATSFTLSVASYRSSNSRPTVMLEQTCLGGPAAMYFQLTPEDAEVVAANLLHAAQQVRDMQAQIDGGAR